MSKASYVYVFCAVRGQPSPRVVAKLPSMPDGELPRVLPLGDISLIVANVPADKYSARAIEARLNDLDWVARCGAAHHALSDRLAGDFVVAPFRLFTLFSSEAKALATLGRARSRIARALDRVKGRAEWALRIGKPDPHLAMPVGGLKSRATSRAADLAGPKSRATSSRGDRPTRQVRGNGPVSGTSFLHAKAQARKADAERLTRVVAEVAAVFDALAAVADEANTRPVEAATGLILDAAFLVPVRKTRQFKQTLTKVASGLLREGCRVSLTGPWPPYSFVSLGATRTSASSASETRSNG